MRMIFISIIYLFILIGCQEIQTEVTYIEPVVQEKSPNENKFNGLSFVGGSNVVDSHEMNQVASTNANSITLMPYAYGSEAKGELHIAGTNWQYWGEKKGGIETCVRIANQANIDVMIKPHIWFDWGTYTGDVGFETEEEWISFESKFREYTLSYAEVSEAYECPVYCIATEMDRFAVEREPFWRELIQEIKTVYKGKLTYAANWDSYQKIPFWDELDYIGIDAYFPLSEEKNPTLDSLDRSWDKHRLEIESFSKQMDRKVMFPEWGYRSCDYNCKEPWDYNEKRPVNLEAQSVALTAIYNEFWDQDWFVGGFLWKWFPTHQSSGGTDNNRFTPQNKPAQKTIQSLYSRGNQ